MPKTLQRILDRIRRRRESVPGPTASALARKFAEERVASSPESGRESFLPKKSRTDLEEYFQSRREGRGIWKWSHYFEIYDRHLAKFVDRDVHLAEVGVYSGGSLEMWRHYFGERCHVTGIDIQPACLSYADAHTTIVIGDQADPAFWKRFREGGTRTVDVLIDDGGHSYDQQRVTLQEMLPYLSPGGVYICEDIHGRDNEFARYAQTLAGELNAFTPAPPQDGLITTATPFQSSVASMHFYPFALVIEKTCSPRSSFAAPKRGTQWEPFL